MSLPADAAPMSFVVTTDRDRAKRFYGGVLGLALTQEDDFAAVFDLHGVPLRISTVSHHVAAEHTVLGWRVRDIEAAVRGLGDRGVVFTFYEGFGQDALGIWSAPGSQAKVAWFKDPDGNVLSLAQL